MHRRNIFPTLWLFVLLFALVAQAFTPVSAKAASGDIVYVIPVEQGVERGLQKFLERAFSEAIAGEADMILLEIDTPGGEVDAADQIGALIRNAPVPVVAYIVNEAFSAGTYIALNADQIIMQPGSAMGAAAPINLAGNMAEQKFVSAWTKKMMEAAAINQRDTEIARAMVDPNVEISGLTKKGEILSLGSSEALKHGYAEHIAKDRKEALAKLNMEGADVFEIQPTIGEQIARVVTHPVVMPLLLAIGIIGLAVELLIPGFGAAGIVGVSAFVIYFLGHFFAGSAEWLHIILFVAGVILMLIELFLPGFGIFGGLGIVSLIAGVVMSAYDTGTALISLGIALVVSIIAIIVIIKYFGHRGVWNRLILKDELRGEAGYNATLDLSRLQDKMGTSLTPLRPSGTAVIDGERIDVVTEGGHIDRQRPIQVVKVEGTRVVVRESVQSKDPL